MTLEAIYVEMSFLYLEDLSCACLATGKTDDSCKMVRQTKYKTNNNTVDTDTSERKTRLCNTNFHT